MSEMKSKYPVPQGYLVGWVAPLLLDDLGRAGYGVDAELMTDLVKGALASAYDQVDPRVGFSVNELVREVDPILSAGLALSGYDIGGPTVTSLLTKALTEAFDQWEKATSDSLDDFSPLGDA